jgi:hypothetical protein
MRQWTGFRALVGLVGLGLAPGPILGAQTEEATLVVHEWGTFSTVVGADGVPLAWRPLSGPPDLPGFVHARREAGQRFAGAGRLKGRTAALVRMETPVVYFYADRDLDLPVDVEVTFPGGLVTEWYPRATSLAAEAEAVAGSSP